jgi:hypothetical protein
MDDMTSSLIDSEEEGMAGLTGIFRAMNFDDDDDEKFMYEKFSDKDDEALINIVHMVIVNKRLYPPL